MTRRRWRWRWSLVALTLAGLAGCRVSDLLFGALRSHYTGGGAGAFDKQRDYDQRVEEWRAAGGLRAISAEER